MRIVLAALALVGLGACAEPTPTFGDAEQAILASLSLAALRDPPPDPSNRVADDPRAVTLGRRLFFDPRLSGDGTRSCASCHEPARFFTDGRATGQGVEVLARNTPTLVGSAWQTWFYWDGRRDSLWSQAIVPIEAPKEMAGTRVGAVRLLAGDAQYRKHYEALFGVLGDEADLAALPPRAGPYADAAARKAWSTLRPRQQQWVDRVFANLGKAIAAYERTLVPNVSPFDRLMAAQGTAQASASRALSDQALAGARLFADVARTRCLQCHSGPLLTNGDFHNIGTGTLSGEALDFGRMFGMQSARLDPFNCLGAFSDAPRDACSALRFLKPDHNGESAGAFKVPTLRNVAATGPYFHDGRFNTLREVLEHYNNPPEPGASGAHELVPLGLTDLEIEQLVAFLESLTSERPGDTAADSSS